MQNFSKIEWKTLRHEKKVRKAIQPSPSTLSGGKFSKFENSTRKLNCIRLNVLKY